MTIMVLMLNQNVYLTQGKCSAECY